MAQVPYSPTTGAVAQGVPQDYENIQANPNEFGGLIAQGEHQFGAGLEQAASQGFDYQIRAQHMFNEAAVNKAQADYLEASNGILHSPPQVGPDGAPVPGSGGFYSTRGDQALPAYDAAVQTLNQSRDQIAASLHGPVQQNMFEALTRRLHDYAIMDMGRHVDQQVTQAADAKTQSLIDTTSQTAGLAAQSGHMDRFDELIQQGKAAAQSWGAIRGYGSDWGTKYAERFVGQTVQNAARQMADAGNLEGASSLVAKYRDQMDLANQLAVDSHLKGALQDKAANDFARSVVLGGTSPAAPNSDAIGARIIDIEGSGKNPASTAEGGGQFTNATWLQTIKSVRPDLAGKSDQDLLALRRNPDMARSMTTAYAAQNATVLADANMPVTPGNIYLAHHFGAAGAIQILSADPSASIGDVVGQKVVAANPDLAGKTVAQVRNQADAQMAGIGPAAAVKQDKAQALSQALGAFSDDPTMQRKAAEAINRTYASMQTAAAAQTQATRDQANQALDGYIKRAMTNPSDPQLVADIAKDPAFNNLPSLREQAWNVVQAHAKSGADGDLKTYGPGIWDVLKRINLPQSDPNRISDAHQLWALGGDNGQLTMSGIDRASRVLNDRSTPEGKGVQDTQTHMLDYAKHQLSFEADYGTFKIPDPKGMDIFNASFIPAFYKYMDDGEKAGKSPQELLTRDNMDKLISGFKRPAAQLAQDQLMAAHGVATAQAPTPTKLVEGKVYQQNGHKFRIVGGQPQYIPDAEPAPPAPAAQAPFSEH